MFEKKADLNEYLETGDESGVDSYEIAYIKDPTAVVGVGTFSYTISTDSTSSSSVTEGSDITVTITRNISGGNPGESTIYLNTTSGTADESDYTAQKATAINFTNSDTTKAVFSLFSAS